MQSPWEALKEAIAALRGVVDHEMGRSQMQKALEQLKTKFGVKMDDAEASASHTPRLVRRQKRMLMQDLPKRRGNGSGSSGDEDFIRRPAALDAMSPKVSSKKQRHAKKSRIQEQVEATPATREANQSLVDLLVQLGDFEMHHGHTQRGLSRIRAAKQIRDSKEVITSGAQARRLDRVGPSVAAKVDQLLNEGLEEALRESACFGVLFWAFPSAMNRRQALRSLADLIARCEAAHIQLSKDPLEARAQAVDAILGSLKCRKVDLDAAKQQLEQKFDIEPAWKQHLEEEEAKHERRRLAHYKKALTRGRNVAANAQCATGLELASEASAKDDPSPKEEAMDSAQEAPAAGTGQAEAQSPADVTKRPAIIQDEPSEALEVADSTKLQQKDTEAKARPTVGLKVAKKAKNARNLIVGAVSDDAEKQQPPSRAKSTAHKDDPMSSGSEDYGYGKEIIDLLKDDDDDDDEGEGDDDLGSDEEFTL
ncbi:hypothetical protein BBJ28_00016403 [Nothophytophthora sp. Chile5]|nr:hypothetical protein BBJ28_00016403 [Nothophytophthora sp. Chile5]